MKKYLELFVVLLIAVIALTGCGRTNNHTKSPKSEDVPKASNTRGLKQADLEEKVIVDKDGVKVTVKGIKYDGLWGPDIKLLIENNNTRNIMVQTRNFSINGIMIDPSFSEDVAAGKKANGSISVSIDDLKVANISGIKDIEFDMIVVDGDSWDDIFTQTGIKLQTDIKDYEQTYDVEGTTVLDQNGVKVKVLKVDDKDSFWGADIYVYIENNTSKVIGVQAKDVSINGFMVDPSFSADATAGKKRFDTISFFEDDLKDNDIEDIDEIELKFVVFDYESFNTIFETDVKKISFK